MDKSIIQALNGLIPTITGPLPPELIELAVSLLAQSRNKASSLKAEEEIARSFACAHLACERFVLILRIGREPGVREKRNILMRSLFICRLKLSLGLPKIQPRPPCPPRIYQKLYKYLDSALTAGTRRSGRPARQLGDGSASTRSSPGKTRTPAKATLFKASTPRTRGSHGQQSFASEVPEWVMSLIRHLCKALGAPAAPPHVFAGVSSILTLPAPNQKDNETMRDSTEKVNVSALIIVVYLLVRTRLNGVSTPPEEFIRQRSLAIDAIQASGIKEAVAEVSDGSEVVPRIMSWMREISSNGWTELDWFANVREGSGLSVDAGDAAADDVSGDERGDLLKTNSIVKHLDFEEDEDPNVLRPGLGTMVSKVFLLDSKLICGRCKTELTTLATGGSWSIRSGRKVFLCASRI